MCLGQVVGLQAVWSEVVQWVCFGQVVSQQVVWSGGTAMCLVLDDQLVIG